MTIRFTRGDLFDADAHAIVNTVNCVGVMGRGIALQFKRSYPENFEAYAAACKAKEVKPGVMFVHETRQLTGPRLIVNFPTKRHWRGKSRIEDIEVGLDALVELIKERGIPSIAIPPLGSGLGGLVWADVKARIEQRLGELTDVDIVVFEPGGGPSDAKRNRSRKVPKMTPGRAALVGLMHRYLAALMDFEITLLEVQKLMYFMQESGEPLRLKVSKGHYGPYAENLRHVLNAVEGHMISGYSDGGDAPDKRLELVPNAVEDATAFIAKHPETRERMERVFDLLEGFETPFGLELLSTVHFVQRDAPLDEGALVGAVHGWSDRKRMFKPAHIVAANRRLHEAGWLSARPQ